MSLVTTSDTTLTCDQLLRVTFWHQHLIYHQLHHRPQNSEDWWESTCRQSAVGAKFIWTFISNEIVQTPAGPQTAPPEDMFFLDCLITITFLLNNKHWWHGNWRQPLFGLKEKRIQKIYIYTLLRGALKSNHWKNLVFCPNWGGGVSANPKFWFKFSKGVFVAIWRGFPSPNQQNHQKSHKKSSVTQKVWLFHEKIICLE